MPEHRSPIVIELKVEGAAQLKTTLLGLSENLNRAKTSASAAGRQLSATGASAARAGDALKNIAKQVLALAAAWISVRAAISGLSSAIQRAAGLHELALQTGLTAAQVMELQQEIAELGLSSGNASNLIMRMGRAIGEAASDGGPALEALERMGLKIEDLLQLDPARQFAMVRNALASIQNPAERAARGMEIFGREALVLMPLFAKTSDNISRLTDGMRTLAQTARMSAWLRKQWNDAMDSIRGFFAGVVQAIGPELDNILAGIHKLPFGEWGRDAGAFVLAFKNAVAEGRLSEFIATVLEAGAEIGGKAAAEVFRRLFTVDIGKNLLAGIVNILAGLGQVMRQIIMAPVPYYGAAMLWIEDQTSNLITRLWNQVKVTGTAVFNVLLGLAEKLANAVLAGFTKAYGALSDVMQYLGMTLPELGAGPIELPRIEPPELTPAERTRTFGEWLEVSKSATAEATETWRKQIDEGAASLIEKLGFETVEHTATATERLKNEIKKVRDELERSAAARKEETTSTTQTARVMNMQLELEKLELRQKTALTEIEERLARVSSDWRTTDATKWHEQNRLLEEQKRSLSEYRASLESLAASDRLTTKERLDIEQKILEARRQSTATEVAEMRLGPAPESYTDQFRGMLLQLENEWGSWAMQLAASFKTAFGSAISSIASGITGLIMGTKRWADALREIGTSILTSIVQAIVQMGARWIATQIMVAMFGKALAATSLAATIPIATAAAATWSTPAYLASVATYGGAAGAGAGALVAGQASTTAAMVGTTAAGGAGGFEKGGFTGEGRKDEVAGVVHRGEYVLDHETVRRIGVPVLESLRSGAAEIVLGQEPGGTRRRGAEGRAVQPATAAWFQYEGPPSTQEPTVGIADQPVRIADLTVGIANQGVRIADLAVGIANQPVRIADQGVRIANFAIGMAEPTVGVLGNRPAARFGLEEPLSIPRLPAGATGPASPGLGGASPSEMRNLLRLGAGALARGPMVPAMSEQGQLSAPNTKDLLRLGPAPARLDRVEQRRFEAGGFTGQGPRTEPAGIVHRGEYVFDALTVRRLGVETLEKLRRGTADVIEGASALDGYSAGGLVGGGLDNIELAAPTVTMPAPNLNLDGLGQAGMKVDGLLEKLQARETKHEIKIAMYGDKGAALDALRSSRGRKLLVDVLRQELVEL